MLTDCDKDSRRLPWARARLLLLQVSTQGPKVNRESFSLTLARARRTKKELVSEAQRSDGETTDGWIPGMSLPSVSGRLSAPLRFALKSPVSSLASRQDEIANFVSRFHGILGGRASAREKRKRTRDSFFILWLSRVIPFPFLGLQADSR